MQRVPVAVVIVALAVVSVAVQCEELSWLSMGTSPLGGGYGQSVLGTNDAIYVLQCRNASSSVLFYRYHPAESVWHELSTAGLREGAFRNGASLAWDGQDAIYALGGARYDDEARTEFLRYAISTDTWEMLDPTPFPQGAGNALTWSGYDDSLYAFLGSRSHDGNQSRFVRYNAIRDEWTSLSSAWANTDDGAALSWTGNQYIYALRGEYIEETPSTHFARYDITANLWETLPEFPGDGGIGDGGSLLWIGQWLPEESDKLYALSGGAADEAPGFDVFTYEIQSEQWLEAGEIPCPVGYYVGNRLGYAAGSIFYWQGSPGSAPWLCGGDAFFAATLQHVSVVENPCEACVASINQAQSGDFAAVSGIGETKALSLVSAQPYELTVYTLDAILTVLDDVYGIGAALSERVARYFCPQLYPSD